MARITECPKCNEPFHVDTSGDYPSRDPESIICPHCQHVLSTHKVRFNYDTRPLTADEKAAWEQARADKTTKP